MTNSSTNTTRPRFAVYWVPPATHPLWAAGCQWLGRDPESDEIGEAPDFATAPWRYGFHATLKAPMCLRSGCTEPEFLAAVAELARCTRPFAMPVLHVDQLSGFVALRPEHPLTAWHPLRKLADQVVWHLDRWRELRQVDEVASPAPGMEHHAARSASSRWGYPHVFEYWRFHMTLSDPCPAGDDTVWQRAQQHFQPVLALPLQADGIAVFRESEPGVPLRLIRRFGFDRASGLGR